MSGFVVNYLILDNQTIENAGNDSNDLNVQPTVDEENNSNNLNVKQEMYPEISDAGKIFVKCKYDMHCVVEGLTDVARKEDKSIGKATFLELFSLYTVDQQNSRCHNIGHHLGEWIYGYTQDLEEAMQYADPLSCGGGIYHGIFENYFSVYNFKGINPEHVEIKHLCDNVDERYSLDMAHCLHGLGHGLLILYKNDLFGAVNRCDVFDSDVKRNSCANGIFMQNDLTYFETGDGTFDEDDIFYPCNEIAIEFAPNCYIWQAPYILKQHYFEVYSSFEECDRIVPEFIKYCYYGIGTELQSDAEGKMEKALQFCQAGSIEEYHQYCLKGMLMTTSMVYLSNGFGFCSLVPEEFKAECYDGLGFWVELRHENDIDKEKDCLRAENDKYFEICMNPKSESISYL